MKAFISTTSINLSWMLLLGVNLTFAKDDTKYYNTSYFNDSHDVRAGHLQFVNQSPFQVEITSITDALGNYPPKCNAFSGASTGDVINPGKSTQTIQMIGNYNYGDAHGKYLSGCLITFTVKNVNFNGGDLTFYINVARDQYDPGWYGKYPKETWVTYVSAFSRGCISSGCNGVTSDSNTGLYLVGGFKDWKRPDDTKYEDSYYVTLSQFPVSCDAAPNQPIYSPDGSFDNSMSNPGSPSSSPTPLSVNSCSDFNGKYGQGYNNTNYL